MAPRPGFEPGSRARQARILDQAILPGRLLFVVWWGVFLILSLWGLFVCVFLGLSFVLAFNDAMCYVVEVLTLAVSGFCAGVLGGFLGVGGGIVVLPLLVLLFKFPVGAAVGTTILIVFLNSVISSFMHLSLRNFDVRLFKVVIVPGIIGSVVGSLLFTVLSRVSWILKICLGIYFMYVSIRTLFEISKEERQRKVLRGWRTVILSGFAAGLVVGLLGLGSGAVLVPVFAYVVGLPIRIAVGTSLLCFAPMALVSVLFKMMTGKCDIMAALCMLPGLIAGARLGSRLLTKVPIKVVKAVFSIAFLMIGLKFLVPTLLSRL